MDKPNQYGISAVYNVQERHDNYPGQYGRFTGQYNQDIPMVLIPLQMKYRKAYRVLAVKATRILIQ